METSTAVYLTGFGKFGHILENPTTDLCKECDVQRKVLDLTAVRVLETSGEGAMETLSELYRQAEKSTASRVVFVHLGVNAKSERFQIESTAYNCANFSIPDERGWIAANKCISSDNALDEGLTTSLDTKQLVSELQTRGHLVESSIDPGRYICNYVYYHSLQWAKKNSNATVSTTVYILQCIYGSICILACSCYLCSRSSV